MKIRIGQKKQVNEIIGAVAAATAFIAVLVLALAAFYKIFANGLKKGDERLKEGDALVKKGAEELPPEVKDSFLQRYNDAVKSLNETAQKLKAAGGDAKKAAALGGRPSTIIANEIRKVIMVVKETEKYPDAYPTFEEAIKKFTQTYDEVSRLDFMILLGTKGKNSLYVTVLSQDAKAAEALSDPQKLFEFGQMLSNAINMKASKLPKFDASNIKAADTGTESEEEAQPEAGAEGEAKPGTEATA